MSDTNYLMYFFSASLGRPGVGDVHRRTLKCNGKRRPWGRPTEVVLLLAYGESGTAERGRKRLMRWRRGEMSGHDLAREPGLDEQRDHRLGEMPLPVRNDHVMGRARHTQQILQRLLLH